MNSNWVYVRAKWAWLDPMPIMPGQTGASSAAYDGYIREFRIATVALWIGLFVHGSSGHPLTPLAATINAVSYTLAVLGAAGMLLAYGRYVRHWDELQQRIGSTASAIALAATIFIFFINALAAQRHLLHANPIVVAIVPLASYWIAVIVVRARFAGSESSEES